MNRTVGIRWILSLIVVLGAFLLTGCSSTEPENQATRPWGAPAGGWESGLPSSLTEGR